MKNLVYPVLFVLFSGFLFAESVPGRRPDLAPSMITGIMGSLEDKTLDQSLEVKSSREIWQTTPHFQKEGIYFFRHYKRKRTKEDYENALDILKDLLASTPSDSEMKKSDVIKDVQAPAASNAEIIELEYSFENLRNLVKKNRTELLRDKTNLDIAAKYYDAHVECLATMVEMHDEFIQNIDVIYKPKMQRLIKKVKLLQQESEQRLGQDISEESSSRIKDLMANQKVVIEKLTEAKEVLPEQKKWAAGRLTMLTEKLMVARLASETLHASKEARSIITEMDSNLDALSLTPPPLIIFELDMSDF